MLEDVGAVPVMRVDSTATLCPPAGALAQAETEPCALSCPQPARAVRHVPGKTCADPAGPLLSSVGGGRIWARVCPRATAGLKCVGESLSQSEGGSFPGEAARDKVKDWKF